MQSGSAHKSTSLSAIANVAYDTSTFGIDANGNWTDQLTHNPNARYWIPTLDEWMKAVHYDPNRSGPGQGGYWMYPNSSDTSPIYGPPGTGQANAGFTLPGNAQYDILLGLPIRDRSPWGLLDTAGGTRVDGIHIFEVGAGCTGLAMARSSAPQAASQVTVSICYAEFPYIMDPGIGWIASAVPSPSVLLVLGTGRGNLSTAAGHGTAIALEPFKLEKWPMPRLAIPTLALLLPGSPPALAQVGPDGYDWVTIGRLCNNPAYSGPDPFNLVTGRGSVSYDYRLSRQRKSLRNNGWTSSTRLPPGPTRPPTLISHPLGAPEPRPRLLRPGHLATASATSPTPA